MPERPRTGKRQCLRLVKAAVTLGSGVDLHGREVVSKRRPEPPVMPDPLARPRGHTPGARGAPPNPSRNRHASECPASGPALPD